MPIQAPSSTPQTLDDLFGGPPVSSSSSSSLNKPPQQPHRDLDDLFGLGGGTLHSSYLFHLSSELKKIYRFLSCFSSNEDVNLRFLVPNGDM